MSNAQMIQPFLKWAGGKRQLLGEIRQAAPRAYRTYHEPFVGAGAVLFDLQPDPARINDVNAELINTYLTIRDQIEELLADLRRHRNDRDYYYSVRDWDRSPDYASLSPVQRASRLIYLNKTCYNGLFRVNSQGQFNVPFGKYANPNIVNEAVLRDVHGYLSTHHVTITNLDFATAAEAAEPGDFVYFDPPYDPVSQTSSFTGYSLDGFGRAEQERLRDVYVRLDKRGCKVLLSNSATDYIKDLYRDYDIRIVGASRSINSVASKRGKLDEVLVMNYEPDAE